MLTFLTEKNGTCLAHHAVEMNKTQGIEFLACGCADCKPGRRAGRPAENTLYQVVSQPRPEFFTNSITLFPRKEERIIRMGFDPADLDDLPIYRSDRDVKPCNFSGRVVWRWADPIFARNQWRRSCRSSDYDYCLDPLSYAEAVAWLEEGLS